MYSHSTLPLLESTPITAAVSAEGGDLDFLNRSVDLLDLDNQEPGSTQVQAEPTHENILLVTDTLECTEDVTSNGSFVQPNSPIHDSEEAPSVNVQPSEASAASSSSFDNSSLSEKRGKGTTNKQVRLPLSSADRSQQSGPRLNQSLINEIDLVKMAKSQKRKIQLVIREHGRRRALNIEGGGVSKKGYIKWECIERSCPGKLKTQILGNYEDFIESYKVGTRLRFKLKDDILLTTDDLKKIERTPHTCSDKYESKCVLNRISQECEKIVRGLPDKPLKRPQVSAVKEQAINTIYAQLNEASLKRKPLKLPPTTIPRKVARLIREKYSSCDAEINQSNKKSYEFDESMYDGHFVLDDVLAKNTENDTLLFYSKYLLQFLTTGDHMGISDG